MKISLQWLNKYLSSNIEQEELLEVLTMLGLEVDSVVDRFDYLTDVLVGKVVAIDISPRDSSLLLCEVNCAGSQPIIVKTRARNIVVGSLVPVAKVNDLVSCGTIPFEEIRGNFSESLFCTERDLKIGIDNKNVVLLDNSAIIGKSVKKILSLSDPVFEISLTPNRPDCANVIGVARELAASYGLDVCYPYSSSFKVSDDITHNSIYVSIASSCTKDCPRYAARVFDNVKIGSSPFWLQDHLFAIGMKPINNVVDITNFVMMEMGQPLHSYDLNLLEGNRIFISHAREAESFNTLDGSEVSLSKGVLTIYDAEKPVAIAGIIGSSDSGVNDKTNRVVLESAYFDPSVVRMASKKLGIATESSYRFERGTDPDGVIRALDRATNLMVDILDARLIGNYIKGGSIEDPSPTNVIELNIDKVNRILGTDLDVNQIVDFLSSIEFSVRLIQEGYLEIKVPSFRVDVMIEEDLIEEIARLYGYRNIPVTFPKLGILNSRTGKNKKRIDTMKIVLAGLGFSEIINYSFSNVNSLDHLSLSAGDFRRCKVEIMNPISSGQSILRTSLFPAILETVRRNISNKIKDLMFFEIGKVFIYRGKKFLPREIEMLVVVWTGFGVESSWCDKERSCDFFDIKGALENFLDYCGVQEVVFTKAPDSFCSYMRKRRTAQFFSSDSYLGLVGEVNPDVLKNYYINQRVFAFEIEIDRLCGCLPDSKFTTPISRFPSVSRDATVIVAQKVEAGVLLNRIRSFNEALVEDVSLISVFHKLKYNPNMKSISFRIIYRSHDLTLSDKIVNYIHARLVSCLVEEFNASLPLS